MHASHAPAVLIAGPTASGKSAFALQTAEAIGGVIINADSMQVYAELQILTARPGAADLQRVPHRLYGMVSANERYSAGQWLTAAAAALREADRLGLRPIFTGGTGLYFEALLNGLAPVPEISEGVRARVQTLLQEEGLAALHNALLQADPEMAARVRPSDPQRLSRALEVIWETGRSLADYQRQPHSPPLLRPSETVGLVIYDNRAELYDKINRRLFTMVETGALAEVEALLESGIDPNLPAMKALGVPAFKEYLSGALPLEDAIAAAQKLSRRYAKRQLTWLRRKMCAWKWLNKKEMESFSFDNLPKMTIS